MLNSVAKFRFPLSLLLGSFFAIFIVVYRPGYLINAEFLGALIFMQLFAAILWGYATRFFPFLMIAFLGPASALPLQGMWTSVRWFVLGVGAFVGLIIYIKDRQHYFGLFHLVAFFCVLAALVSAQMSAYSGQALLKASSLFLLFLYGASGARLAVNHKQFSSGLLLACELLIYFTASLSFALHVELFANPNSLGALLGVIAVPLMLWGTLVANELLLRRRRIFAFCLALLMLLSSYSRASIAAAGFSCLLLCLVARRYRSIFQGLALAVLLAVSVVVLSPPKLEPSASVSSAFLYKGHRESGVLGSRNSIWDRTVSTIQEHPWFGTGFGTADALEGAPEGFGLFSSSSEITREHGNSYLAIAEGVGIIGLLPFVWLILLLLRNLSRVWLASRRSGNIRSLAIPLAAILSAGLIHAAFEDWLFAVGYYLCVFFWALAFILVDFLPSEERGLTMSCYQSVRPIESLATIQPAS